MYAVILMLLMMPAICFGQSDGFVSLMPKADLSEHWSTEPSPPGTWSFKDGVIEAKGNPMGVLRSNKQYKNFILRFELRFRKEGWTKAPAEWPNAGVFIFASKELREKYPRWPQTFVEIQGHYGEIASAFGGNLKGAIRYEVVPPDKHGPLGEWDKMEVTTHNGHVTIKLNGQKVNEGSGADPMEGYLCLESEGWPVYYRNIAIKVLPD